MDTDDEGAIEAAEKLVEAMTARVRDRWCDADTDDEDAIETKENMAGAEISFVADQPGCIGQQRMQECWPTLHVTPLSGAHQVMALQAQASQLRAQARQAEDAALLARKACARTPGQHSKRSRKRAARRLEQLQDSIWQNHGEWHQHCDQSWTPACASMSFPVRQAAPGTLYAPPRLF